MSAKGHKTDCRCSFCPGRRPVTKETREKMSVASRGRKKSDEHARNISKGLTGKKLSEEHRASISRCQKGKKHSEEIKARMSKTHKQIVNTWTSKITGEKHHNWIKDRSQLVMSEKKHLDCRYREWAKSVKNRDGWQCKIDNGDCSGRVEAHHILAWRNHPELRYKINNGITLCHLHHPRGGEQEKRLEGFLMSLVSVSSD